MDPNRCELTNPRNASNCTVVSTHSPGGSHSHRELIQTKRSTTKKTRCRNCLPQAKKNFAIDVEDSFSCNSKSTISGSPQRVATQKLVSAETTPAGPTMRPNRDDGKSLVRRNLREIRRRDAPGRGHETCCWGTVGWGYRLNLLPQAHITHFITCTTSTHNPQHHRRPPSGERAAHVPHP